MTGENYELRADLNSEYREKRKDTVKKVIANMTLGKDVSSLFPDVVKNMQTEDLELKKLVYLYLINYAKTQPELVILAVNTFVKDSDDHNPLIRALAIRTMGCLRVEKIFDYLMDPLKKALKDDDPYVRKTGALCVSKLFDLNPQTAIENGLINTLQELLSDRNPMVIANAVAALAEISDASVQKDLFLITESNLQKLLAALNECTEWGQTCILMSLSAYKPKTAFETSDIIERVLARLQHSNASVVLAAVKLLVVFMDYGITDELHALVIKKLTPPLITLLATPPEIQYVALRNINLILQKKPGILKDEVNVFFTKYNDPPYVKIEKLEVIVRLVSDSNIDQVLSELKEYANEVDVEFVRKSVRIIGRCAIKLERASDKCVQALIELLNLGVNYIIQETVIVMKDIFRKYPTKYEGVIPVLCSNLESLDGADPKAALIWIIGDYAHRIENAAELLEHFLENFKYEMPKVQLQLITATVKLFLKRPENAQGLVQKLLKNATEQNENPDIRDRAFIYWRLLSASPEAAKKVVLAEKPPIDSEGNVMSEVLLDELIKSLGSLASVLHKSPSLLGNASYIDMTEYRDLNGDEEQTDAARIIEAAKAMGTGTLIENLLDLDFDAPAIVPSGSAASSPVIQSKTDQLLDLMSMDVQEPAAKPMLPVLLSAANGQGLEILGHYALRNQIIYLDLTFYNKTSLPMTELALQFNVNSFGLTPAGHPSIPMVPVGQSYSVSVQLNRSGAPQKMDPPSLIQIAVKNNSGIYYFTSHIPATVCS